MIKLDEFGPYKNVLLNYPNVVTFGHKPVINSTVASPTRELTEMIVGRAQNCLAALVQLGGTLEDMQTAYKIVSKYPWHGTEITKVQHLELTWFLFQNLCYKFREKIKLYFNSSKTICETLGIDTPTWLKKELKKTEKVFQREIRDRGNTVHSWNAKNSDIDFFSLASQLHSAHVAGENVDLPEGFLDVAGHYKDAKRALRERAKELILSAEATFCAILESYTPTPEVILDKVNAVIDGVNHGEFTLTPKGK